MKITKSQLKQIIKEELDAYTNHLTTDDVERAYKEAGRPAPYDFSEIRAAAQAYESGVLGQELLVADIIGGTVKGIDR
jgi:hypothetical protein